MREQLLKAMMEFAHEAGSLAAGEQGNLRAQLKADDTYVTDVDRRVSELAVQKFEKLVPDDCIITEERIDDANTSTGPRESNDGELLVVVDPIDGTRNYFHNMPLYGISVGVLRDLRPWLGVVTFPGLGETFYCTGSEALVIAGAYGSKPVQRALVTSANDGEVGTNSQILLANSFARKHRWSYDVCTILLTGCVTINACWPTLQRGIGAVFTDHIWDIAGAWPIFKQVGFELRGAESGRPVTEYYQSDYDPETSRVREPMIVSKPAHFERLREGIIKL